MNKPIPRHITKNIIHIHKHQPKTRLNRFLRDAILVTLAYMAGQTSVLVNAALKELALDVKDVEEVDPDLDRTWEDLKSSFPNNTKG